MAARTAAAAAAALAVPSTSVRLSSGRAPRDSFRSGGCAQVGSRSSSLRGAGVVCPSNVTKITQRTRKVVVSPRNVSDSPVVGETCLDPDASRVRLSLLHDFFRLGFLPVSIYLLNVSRVYCYYFC